MIEHEVVGPSSTSKKSVAGDIGVLVNAFQHEGHYGMHTFFGLVCLQHPVAAWTGSNCAVTLKPLPEGIQLKIIVGKEWN